AGSSPPVGSSGAEIDTNRPGINVGTDDDATVEYGGVSAGAQQEIEAQRIAKLPEEQRPGIHGDAEGDKYPPLHFQPTTATTREDSENHTPTCCFVEYLEGIPPARPPGLYVGWAQREDRYSQEVETAAVFDLAKLDGIAHRYVTKALLTFDE